MTENICEFEQEHPFSNRVYSEMIAHPWLTEAVLESLMPHLDDLQILKKAADRALSLQSSISQDERLKRHIMAYGIEPARDPRAIEGRYEPRRDVSYSMGLILQDSAGEISTLMRESIKDRETELKELEELLVLEGEKYSTIIATSIPKELRDEPFTIDWNIYSHFIGSDRGLDSETIELLSTVSERRTGQFIWREVIVFGDKTHPVEYARANIHNTDDYLRTIVRNPSLPEWHQFFNNILEACAYANTDLTETD